jgi:hypothetical protein
MFPGENSVVALACSTMTRRGVKTTGSEGICTKTNAAGVYGAGGLILHMEEDRADRFRGAPGRLLAVGHDSY